MIEDDPTKLFLIAAVIFLIVNSVYAFLIKILLPWQTKRLLKKWKIHIKNSTKIPLLAQLQQLVMPMSGVVTYGAPVVTDIFPNGISSARLLALAAAIENGIDHPIAESIYDEARVRGLELPEISASNLVPGKGVEALMNRQTLSLGSAKFLEEQNIEIPAEIFTKADQLAYKGQIIVFVAIGKFCRGFITLHDKVKRSVPGDISFLNEMGIGTTIITASNRTTAKSYTKPTGVELIRSELNSMDKAKEVLVMQTSGQVVGSVGRHASFEGAMKSSDIGFALEYAEPGIKNLADVLIHTNSLGTIATAKGIARVANGKKKSEILLCVIFNVLLFISLAFLCNLESLPALSAILPILVGVFFLLAAIANQIPLKY